MREWHALAQRMILGCDTNPSPFTSDDPALNAFFVQLQPLRPPQQLTRALAGLQWLRKLGKDFSDPTPHTSIAQDTSPACTPATAAVIQIALQARQINLLLETFTLMQHRQHHLSVELLVDCFTLAEKHPPLQKAVNDVAGTRGRWLAQQNPAWQFVTNTDLASLQGDALLQSLHVQRTQDHATFLQTLEALWSTLGAKERQKILTVFDSHPLPQELAFLQRCQQDRSHGVRQSASRLLFRLQDAASIDSMLRVVQSCLNISGGGMLRRDQLNVTLPESFAKTWEALGIQETLEHIDPAGKLGRKSVWLHQCLALLPPRRLLTALDTNAGQFLALAAKTDHATLLHSAWSHAALLHDDADALQVLLSQLSAKIQRHWLHALLTMANGQCRDLLLQVTLTLPPEKDTPPVASVLPFLRGEGVLSPDLSRRLLEHLQRDVEKIPYWYQGLQQRLDELAFSIAADQIPFWIVQLENHTPERLESCLRWLRCRQQLHQEFSS